MITDKINQTILPKNQLQLFGYINHFNSFIQLSEQKSVPNTILISGQKGLGKSTFAYHIINYLLSKGEDNPYDINTNRINNTNLSYKLVTKSIHPNFYILDSNLVQENIKIQQVRNLIKFLNKTVYSKNLKIIMIDNAEHLNLNASNALLKAIEEPNNNTIFFIIQNSASKISKTLKSRCNEFKIFFSHDKKKDIFKNMLNYHEIETYSDFFEDNLYFDTPGNTLKYYFLFKEKNIDPNKHLLEAILFLIEKYQIEKTPEILSFLSYFIENFYLNLSKSKKNHLSKLFFDQSNILEQIQAIKKYNLNDKNVFLYIKNKLINETR